MANTATHAITTHREPSWWNDHHSRAWDRVKEAFARDWEQTQADFTKSRGRELDQHVTDTLKQAVGSQRIPPRDIPNDRSTYDEAEPALRYGYGASTYYFDHDVWDSSLEAKLRDDWSEIDVARDWKTVRDHVRAGWERARGTRH